jgi:hypothetical protein
MEPNDRVERLRDMRRVAAIVLVGLVCAVAAGCGSGSDVTQFCTSGPCPTGPHHWTAAEVARDVDSNLFPPQGDTRDHLYRTVCHINHDGSRATCVGHRRYGSRPGQRVAVQMLLRQNGTLSLLCWPHPSELCDSIQVSDQRANPITS